MSGFVLGSPARIPLILASGVLRTREREGGSSVYIFRLGHFRDGRPWLKDERRRIKQEK